MACLALARWQFNRSDAKQTAVEHVQQNWDAAPVPLDDVVTFGEALDPSDTWRPVTVRGEYLVSEMMLVRNRTHASRPGYDVMVPFRTIDGTVLAVDRGWLPHGASADAPDEVPAPPAGTVSLLVRVKPTEPEIPHRPVASDQLASFHLPSIATAVAGGRFHTGVYGVMFSETPAPDRAPTLPERPAEDTGPHFSYALQWIIFALMGFVALGWLIRDERRLQASPDAETSRRPRSRRTPSDAEVEDALVDEQHH